MAKKVPFKHRAALGKRLENIRNSKDLTKKEASGKFGVSDTALSKWEEGKTEPPLAYLAYLAENFECDLNWLLMGEEKPHQVSGSQPGEVDQKTKDAHIQLLEENRQLSKENRQLREELAAAKNANTHLPLAALRAHGAALGKE